MAATRTRSRPKRRPAGRRKAPGRGRGRAARKPARRIRRPSRMRRAGASVVRHLSPRAADVLGIGLLVLAALTALGLWFGAGDPVGSFFEVSAKGLVGVAGYAVPVVAFAWAIVLIRGTSPDDRGRLVVGSVILTVGVLGLLSVAVGDPRPLGGYRAVS